VSNPITSTPGNNLLANAAMKMAEPPFVRTELNNVTDRESRQKKLQKQKDVRQTRISDDRASPCQRAGTAKISINRYPRPKIGKLKAYPALVTFVQISAFAHRSFYPRVR
jgi:hypothetical protein